MVNVLYGLCRDVKVFEGKTVNACVEEMKRLTDRSLKLSSQVQAARALARERKPNRKLTPKEEQDWAKKMEERVNARKQLEQEYAAAEKERQQLWLSAIGSDHDEPRLALLTPELLDTWDKSYIDTYRPNKAAKDMLTQEELTISCATAHGVDDNASRALRSAYWTRVRDATAAVRAAAEKNKDTPERDLALYRQMEAKLALLVCWGRMAALHMPPMPLLTRTALRMVINRFEGIEDASTEVSMFFLYDLVCKGAPFCSTTPIERVTGVESEMSPLTHGLWRKHMLGK
jgi:hypothetical protein